MASAKEWLVNAIPGSLVRFFASPYVAGDSLEKALEKADALYRARNVETTLDVLGEMETDRERVRSAVDLYLRTLEAVRERDHCTISVKPGHFGYYVDPSFCKDNLEEMASACQEAGRGLTIDMENTDVTDFTLDVYCELKPKYPILGTVLQSRLHRTLDDVDRLGGLAAHVRVCIGIYKVPEPMATQSKRVMKENLLKITEKLFDGGHYVCIATHDIPTIEKAWERVRESGIPKDRYEFQMLLGVPREAMIRKLVEAGERVRLYIPYSVHWDDAIAYLRRRMLENPFMAGLVLKNLVRRA